MASDVPTARNRLVDRRPSPPRASSAVLPSCVPHLIALPQEVVMTGLSALWLPILVSSVLVFVASSIIHMASPWHKSDYPRLPNEDKVMDALRPLAIPPGDYFIPRPSSQKDMRSPEFAQKVKAGPVIVFTVMPSGGISMGRNLILW